MVFRASVPCVLSLLVCGALLGCAATEQGATDGSLAPLFHAGASRVVVEVDAMDPKTLDFTPLPSGLSPWAITRANLARAFQGMGVAVEVPGGTEDVGAIASDKRAFTQRDIEQLSQAHRASERDAEVRFHVMFLTGRYAGEGVDEEHQPVALHLGGTRTVAVFQDVAPSGPDVPGWAAVSLQAQLVHELGHALGLVNLETPMVRPHERSGSAGHCSHADCSMARRVSVPAHIDDLVAERRPTEAQLILFGVDCLADLDARRNRAAGAR